jgi:hypothetical protein
MCSPTDLPSGQYLRLNISAAFAEECDNPPQGKAQNPADLREAVGKPFQGCNFLFG